MNAIVDLLQKDNEYYDNQRVTGFVQGVVVENNNSDFKGMVKVEFTVWESGKNMCEWVKILSPYAGAAYGVYCVPEIDEVVLVGFIGGSLKRPFLLGSLYPSSADMVNESFDDKNLLKHIKTKSGVDILINEEDGKQTVTLTTPKGSMIVVDDENESCKISDKNGKNKIELDYKGGAVSIEAEKTLTLKAGSTQFSMDGNAGNIELKGTKIAMSADNEIGIKATAALKMEGAQTELKGQAQVNVQASGSLALKGAMVQLN